VKISLGLCFFRPPWSVQMTKSLSLFQRGHLEFLYISVSSPHQGEKWIIERKKNEEKGKNSSCSRMSHETFISALKNACWKGIYSNAVGVCSSLQAAGGFITSRYFHHGRPSEEVTTPSVRRGIHTSMHTDITCNTAGIAWHYGNTMPRVSYTWKSWNDFISPFVQIYGILLAQS